MSNNLQSMALSVPHSGSIEGYMQAVGRIDMLTADQERQLAVRLREDEDLEAARQLVMSHLRFVVHIAKSYSRRQYWSNESEGATSLIDALPLNLRLREGVQLTDALGRQ